MHANQNIVLSVLITVIGFLPGGEAVCVAASCMSTVFKNMSLLLNHPYK